MKIGIYHERATEIETFVEHNRRMPSYSEMLQLFGVRSKNAVAKTVTVLVNQGVLLRDAEGKLIPNFTPGIRLVGTVEAGFPSPAEEELGDTITLDQMLIPNRTATVMLVVSGDSMSGAGIMAGDMAIVDRSRKPKRGDIVIATVDGNWTMKYLDSKKGQVFLRAANDKYDDIYPEADMTIHGVVVSVVRRYE